MNMLSLLVILIVLPFVGWGIYKWVTAGVDRFSIIMLLIAVIFTCTGLYIVIVYGLSFGDLLMTIGGLFAGIESYVRRKKEARIASTQSHPTK